MRALLPQPAFAPVAPAPALPSPHLPAATMAAAGSWSADGDPWVAWSPGQDQAGSSPGDERIQCSVHRRYRSRRNLVSDGAGGLRCDERHVCAGGVAHEPQRACPRDADSGRRVDDKAAGDLLAPPAPMTDEAILNDLADATACLFHPGPLNDRTRAFLLARLTGSGVDWAIPSSPGWWYSTPTRSWGRLPTSEEVLAAVPRLGRAGADGPVSNRLSNSAKSFTPASGHASLSAISNSSRLR